MNAKDVKIGKEFKPAPEWKTLTYLQLFLILAILILPWYLPVVVFSPFPVIVFITVGVLILVVPILLLTFFWIPLYYQTIIYKLTNNEIIWKRGVWFKNTGVVPYNRITNVDLKQGPLSRIFGLASLKIQTAGYSAQPMAEMKLEGLKNFDEMRDVITSFVRGKKPVAAETYEGEDVSSQILKELVKIRKLLEKRKG